ncbi:amidohydrolase family protein [Nonomuraea ferruginea]
MSDHPELPSRRSPVIDVHAHAVLEVSLGAAGAAGPELGVSPDGTPFYRVGGYVLNGVRYAGSPFMDVDVRIAAMDEAGVDVQLLSPNPLTYFDRLDPGAAVAYARTHNDALAETVGKHPARLLGAAQLPVQDVPASIAEARRAVRELGMAAVYIGTDPAGRTLGDPGLDPLYEALADLDVPLFVHPSPLGPDGPPQDPRLRRFDLDLLFGFARDETLAVAALVFGGVLDRHPGLDVCVSHGGGAAAFVAGRFARAVEKRPWSARNCGRTGSSTTTAACGSTPTCTTTCRFTCSPSTRGRSGWCSAPTSQAGTPAPTRGRGSTPRSWPPTPPDSCAALTCWRSDDGVRPCGRSDDGA